MKRAVLIAVTALMAAALSGPASASAAEWTHEAEPLAENADATFEGQLTFTGKAFWISCWTTVGTTLEPGGAGTVDMFYFQFPWGNCTGGGLLLAGCSPSSTVMEAQELPWAFTPKSSSEIELSGTRFDNNWVSCTLGSFNPTFEGDLVAFPDSSENISSISFNGEESGVLTSSGGGEVTASGTLQASFGAEGAYGIE